MNAKSIQIRVKGHVQGVGFRYATAEKARDLGLNGYVRNLANGDVEIVLVGSPEQQTALLRWLNAGGPKFAHITQVTTNETPLMEEIKGFIIK